MNSPYKRQRPQSPSSVQQQQQQQQQAGYPGYPSQEHQVHPRYGLAAATPGYHMYGREAPFQVQMLIMLFYVITCSAVIPISQDWLLLERTGCFLVNSHTPQ